MGEVPVSYEVGVAIVKDTVSLGATTQVAVEAVGVVGVVGGFLTVVAVGAATWCSLALAVVGVGETIAAELELSSSFVFVFVVEVG